MGDGTRQNPFTREDVLRLIQENGGKAEGLDLSGSKLIDGIDLKDLNLSGVIFAGAQLFRAHFDGSNLDGATMQQVNLSYATFNCSPLKYTSLQAVCFQNSHLEYAEFRGADLTGAQFQGIPAPLDGYQKARFEGLMLQLPAHLDNADFTDANLFLANFKGCYFYGTKLQGAYIRGADIFDSHLEYANWGNAIIGDENSLDFYSSVEYYRRLKTWYTEHGMYRIASEFFFREMTSIRKSMKWQPNPIHRSWSKLLSVLCGYGERPIRVVISASVIMLFFALFHLMANGITSDQILDSLYFSVVSFTALGYGGWVQEAVSWTKWLGVTEAFLGVFMMALFLVTFTRRMSR